MEKGIQNFARLIESIGREVNQFDETTWRILANATAMFGYSMLRGQPC